MTYFILQRIVAVTNTSNVRMFIISVLEDYVVFYNHTHSDKPV